MKKIVLAIILIIAIAAGTWFIVKREENGKPQYRTEKVRRDDLEASVSATGTVNAVSTVSVGTQVSGTIKELYVDYNSLVKQGQLLAEIDPATFQAQVDQARANVLSARANLKKSQAALADAKRTFARNQQLLARNFIAQSDLDTAQTNLETADAQVDAARAQVLQSQAALSQAETNLRYTRILSPVNGTVISRSVDVGQTVAASFQTPTLFSIAEDLTKMQIDTSVDEADIGRVALGQAVHFNVDAYPDTNFNGNVSEIRNAPVTVQNVVTYDVVVRVNNPDLKLKPGMTANVSIITALRKDVLCVPNAALRFKPQGKGKNGNTQVKGAHANGTGMKGPAVWVLDGTEPKRVAVRTGINDGISTEIVAGDLREGQEVILEDLAQTKDKPTMRGPGMFH